MVFYNKIDRIQCCDYYNGSNGILVKKRRKFVAKSIRRFRITLYSGEENPLWRKPKERLGRRCWRSLEERASRRSGAEEATWEEVRKRSGGESEEEVWSGGEVAGDCGSPNRKG